MSVLKKLRIKLSGNNYAQRRLEKKVAKLQSLMGVGAGSGVLSSGEEVIFDILKQQLDLPYVIFDIGANKGQFLQLALDNVSAADCRIHCFEPGFETFKILVDTSKKDSHIKLNNIGVGKEKGEAILHYDNVGSGLASLTKRKLEHFSINFDKEEKVKITTIDDYCSENDISYIHLLKIDIEGHELDALAGAKRMFTTNSIGMVTFEFGGCNIDTRTYFQDFWYLFKELNMSLFRITPSGYLFPITSYKEIHEQFRTTNYIAKSNS